MTPDRAVLTNENVLALGYLFKHYIGIRSFEVLLYGVPDRARESKSLDETQTRGCKASTCSIHSSAHIVMSRIARDDGFIAPDNYIICV